MDSGQYQTDPNLLTFRYALPSEIQLHSSHNHLCDHHRKKLSDLFLLDHLASMTLGYCLNYHKLSFHKKILILFYSEKYNIKKWNKQSKF